MREIRALLVVFLLISVIPGFAQMNSETAAPREITGTVVSFSGNTLDIQPASASAVWVTIPDDMKVDRSALKPGVAVSVQARWDTVTYMAIQPPRIGTAAKTPNS
jgi:hypothetical protein